MVLFHLVGSPKKMEDTEDKEVRWRSGPLFNKELRNVYVLTAKDKELISILILCFKTRRFLLAFHPRHFPRQARNLVTCPINLRDVKIMSNLFVSAVVL